MSFYSAFLRSLQCAYTEVRKLVAVSGAKALAAVMLMPFVGIYQSMVTSGALNSLVGSIGLGIVVFGGPAAISIVFTKLTTSRVQGLKLICLIAAVQLPAAAFFAAVAKASEAALWVEGFSLLTVVVLWIIALDIVNGSTPSCVPSLRTIGAVLGCLMVLNLVVSIVTGEVTVILPGEGILMWMWTVLTTEWVIIGRSLAASFSGLLFVIFSVVFRPTLLQYVNLRRFKMGSAIALCLIGLDVAGFVANAPTVTVVVLSLGLAVEADDNGGDL